VALHRALKCEIHSIPGLLLLTQPKHQVDSSVLPKLNLKKKSDQSLKMNLLKQLNSVGGEMCFSLKSEVI
jgi:hypothetical protein